MLHLEEMNRQVTHYDHFAADMGIQLMALDREHSVVQMPLEARHCNGMGVAHGGAIFTLVDMAFAALSNASGIYCANAQTSISYLEPGRIGPLRGEARCIRQGRISVYEIHVTGGKGTLIALASVTGCSTGKTLPR